MKNHSFSEKVIRFLNGKGFYIALVFCLAAIGGSGWYLWREFSTSRQMAAQASQVEPVTVEPEASADAKTEPDDAEGKRKENTPAAAPADVVLPEDEEDEEDEAVSEEVSDEDEPSALSPAPEEEAKETAEAIELPLDEASETMADSWLWPLDGEVVATFASDTLTYNAALKDWRTHSGIDLSAELGQAVVAAHAGTVASVRDDVFLGKTVVMDVGNGLTTTYGNLAEDVSVSAGDRVAAGEAIGKVGETAAGEHNDAPWIHFSVEKDGTAVNPMDYLG